MSTRMEDLRNALLTDVAAGAAVVMQDHGIAVEVAEQAGAAIADLLADNWGGQIVTVPKDHAFRLAIRDQEILAAFDGTNLQELAKRYDMTERGVRKLLVRAHKRQRDLYQGKLFDD